MKRSKPMLFVVALRSHLMRNQVGNSLLLKFVFGISFVFAFGFSSAQKTLAEFKSEKGMTDFNAVAVGDSILFSYTDLTTKGRVRKSKWINEAEVLDENIPIDAAKGLRHGDDVYLYHLVDADSLELRSLTRDTASNAWSESIVPLRSKGQILGSYIDKNLFVVMLSADGTEISVVEINRLAVAGETKFKLPYSLSEQITPDTPLDVYAGESEINTFQGRARIKIFKYDKLYLVIDHLMGPAKSATSVITLDPADGSAVASRFTADNMDDHGSYILDGKLFYTSIRGSRFVLTIYDLASAQVLAKREIKPGELDLHVYFRYGRKNVIHNHEPFSRLMQSAGTSEPVISVIKKEGNYIVQWGTYLDDNGMMGTSFTPAGFGSMIIGNVVLQLWEGPGLHRYFYYIWDAGEGSFRVRDTAAPALLVREKIDRYEIDQHLRYEFKNYLKYKDGIAGIYYDAKINRVSIVYFN